MGYLKRHLEIEKWLQDSATTVESLVANKYARLVADWNEQFRPSLEAGRVLVGDKGRRALEAELICDVFVFNIPGSRLLPAGTDPQLDRAYAYDVTALVRVDFNVVNDADAIVTDKDLTFAYVGTHEEGALARAWFVRSF